MSFLIRLGRPFYSLLIENNWFINWFITHDDVNVITAVEFYSPVWENRTSLRIQNHHRHGITNVVMKDLDQSLRTTVEVAMSIHEDVYFCFHQNHSGPLHRLFHCSITEFKFDNDTDDRYRYFKIETLQQIPNIQELFCDKPNDNVEEYHDKFTSPLLVVFAIRSRNDGENNPDLILEKALAVYHPLSGTLVRCIKHAYNPVDRCYQEIKDTTAWQVTHELLESHNQADFVTALEPRLIGKLFPRLVKGDGLILQNHTVQRRETGFCIIGVWTVTKVDESVVNSLDVCNLWSLDEMRDVINANDNPSIDSPFDNGDYDVDEDISYHKEDYDSDDE